MGLYLLLAGAQSDIARGRRENRNKYKGKKREDLKNSRGRRCVYVQKEEVGVVGKKIIMSSYHQVSHQQNDSVVDGGIRGEKK